MKFEKNRLGSMSSGISDLLNSFGSLAEEMRRINDIRNVAYRDVDVHLPALSECSWFTSLNLGFSDHERLLFWFLNAPSNDSEKEEYINNIFKSCYQKYFDYLVNVAVEQFPHREFAIRPAAKAHIDGQFALSIPVFISQAEGIIREALSAELFTATNVKKNITNISDEAKFRYAQVSQLGGWLDYADAAHWTQLKEPLPIAYGPADRDRKKYTGLNRNTILHGIDNSYASELNSYKSFSLLCHAAGLAEWLKQEALS